MTETQPTPITQPAPAAQPGRRKRWPYAVAGVGLVGAGYVALAAVTGGTVPDNTTVGGVAVGGMTATEARAALQAGVADRVAAPVPVKLGKKTIELAPAEAGLTVDVAGSLDGLTGFSLDPRDVWAKVSGGAERDLTRLVDEDKLTSALATASKPANVKPENAGLAFVKGVAKLAPGTDSVTVDVPESASAVADGWLVRDPITGVVDIAEPDVTEADAAAAKAEVADKIVAGPVTVKVGEKSFELDGAAIAAAVTFEPKDGGLAAAYDTKKLVAAVREAGREAEVLRAGRDAEVTSVNGSFKIAPSVDGLDVDGNSVAKAIPAAVLDDERSATVTGRPAPATFTTAQAKATLPAGVISTFTTNFPYSTDRTHNIMLAARALNGTYIAPGEQFSLNAHLGQRTAAKGYRAAPVIYNGRLAMDYGGGISQVSTTLFNAVFFSGARIDQYLPHSFYISRYPEGREATISWPDVDQKFTNTTRGGILIQTKVTSNAITVTFLGKKTWDIEAVKGPRVNVRGPATIHDDSEGCVPQSPAEGFDVTVTRIFSQKGKEVDRQHFTTHYIPEDLVICD